MNGAASARAHVASPGRAGEKEVLTDRVEEDVVRAGSNLVLASVHPEANEGTFRGRNAPRQRVRTAEGTNLGHRGDVL
jgi:hypothetical protein